MIFASQRRAAAIRHHACAGRDRRAHRLQRATAIDSVDDDRDHPFVYGATNPNSVPFKNVSLAVIRKFYQKGFKEINGHLAYKIPSKLTPARKNGSSRSGSSTALTRVIERIDSEIAALKKLRQRVRRPGKGQRDFREQLRRRKRCEESHRENRRRSRCRDPPGVADKARLKTYAEAVAEALASGAGKQAMSVERWEKFAAGLSHAEGARGAAAMGVDIFWDWDLPRTPEGSM